MTREYVLAVNEEKMIRYQKEGNVGELNNTEILSLGSGNQFRTNLKCSLYPRLISRRPGPMEMLTGALVKTCWSRPVGGWAPGGQESTCWGNDAHCWGQRESLGVSPSSVGPL